MHLARQVELITADSDALADAAARDLTAPIPSCPDWVMADLVRHIFGVHRSWSRIVGEGLTEPDWSEPDFSEQAFPPDDELVEAFRAHAHEFAAVLAEADPEAPCWTWGPEQNAGFVQRFQVQEAALHRWDAESAVGIPGSIAADGAADALGLDNALLPDAAPGASVAFEMITTDTPFSITMSAAPDLPVIGSLTGTASDLLLVFWSRLPIATVATTGDVDAITRAVAAVNID